MRGLLRRAPAVELEALDPASWSGRDALRRVPPDWAKREAASSDERVVYHAGNAALAQADALLKLAHRAGLNVKRLSVRRTEPNVQLHVSLPDLRQPARDFFEAVQALAERALA